MKQILFSSLVTLFLVSCKKEDKCNLDTNSVSGNYRVTAVKYKQTPSSTEVDYYSFIFPDACDRDDIITLNTNGTYVVADAGVKCTPSNDDTGAWSLSGNTLTIDGDPGNVDSFNCSVLIISQSNFNVAGDKLTLTLTRQ